MIAVRVRADLWNAYSIYRSVDRFLVRWTPPSTILSQPVYMWLWLPVMTGWMHVRGRRPVQHWPWLLDPSTRPTPYQPFPTLVAVWIYSLLVREFSRVGPHPIRRTFIEVAQVWLRHMWAEWKPYFCRTTILSPRLWIAPCFSCPRSVWSRTSPLELSTIFSTAPHQKHSITTTGKM